MRPLAFSRRCRRRTLACRAAARLVMIAAATASLAGAMDARGAGEPATSNQSVVIEEASPPASAESAQPAASRSLRRKPSVLTEALEVDRGAPWYRTSLGALGVVLGLVAVVFLVLRRWAPSVRTPDSGVLKVLGRAGLGPKHSLALVQFGRRFVLVGISPDGVRSLSEVTDGEEAAELAGRAGARWPAGRDDFDSLLTRETTAYEPAGPALAEGRVDAGAGGPAPLRDLLRKLKALQNK